MMKDCDDSDATINPDRQYLTQIISDSDPGTLADAVDPATGSPYDNFNFRIRYVDLNNPGTPPVTPSYPKGITRSQQRW